MNAFYNTCHEAIDYALKTKTFGLYYSNVVKQNLSIHMHDCCEIFLSLSDAQNFLINDKIYSVNKNDLFIINQFESHKINIGNRNDFYRYSLHIHPDFINSKSSPEFDFNKIFHTDNKLDKIHLSYGEAEKLTKLFESLTVQHNQGDEIYKTIRVMEILLETANLCNTHNETQSSQKQNDIVLQAIDYINKNFTRQISLNDVAEHCFISVNHLCSIFKSNLSTTVNKYITSKRLALAKKYLSEGKSVTETAFSCGFNDYANFIRVFKNNIGVPPGKY